MRADDNQEKRDLAGDYLRRARRKNILLAVLLLVLLVAAIWAACLGVAQLTPDRMIVTWLPSFSGMFKGVASLDAKEQNVLLMLRLPRIAAAVIAGAGLGIAGSGMQAITGNPMASPFTTGLSSAAAFGAALMILFGRVCHVCGLRHCCLYSGKLQTASSGSISSYRNCLKLPV